MTDQPCDVPHTVWSGSFRLFGVEVKCHTLSNGQRVIEESSVHALLEAMGKPGAEHRLDDEQAEAFARWQR